jgi:hypothetical protein
MPLVHSAADLSEELQAFAKAVASFVTDSLPSPPSPPSPPSDAVEVVEDADDSDVGDDDPADEDSLGEGA